jgi:protein phosphatase
MEMAQVASSEARSVPVAAHAVSHVGCVRETNEDAWHVDVEHGVFIVADGMGGHSAGEVASGLAVETICEFLARSRIDDGFTWPFGIDANLTDEGNRVATAVRLANRKVYTAADAQPDRSGMGTTVVAALLVGDLLTFASVGDSRLYSFHEGRLEQLTRDDTWIATVLAQNADADPAALQHHPLRHMLTEAVGTMQDVNAVVQERRLAAGEILLLCSDGLHTAVSDADIARLLDAPGATDPQRACAALLDAALKAGARDNVTALVIRRRYLPV